MKFQDLIRQHYEDYYRGGSRRINKILKRVQNNLKGMHIKYGDRVIDIGCGLGATGLYLAYKGAIAFGIDISFEALRVASQSESYTGVLQANVESLPFAERSFDSAILMGTLEHFINPVRALWEINRVLKPRAQICFVVPNSEFFLFKFFGGTGQPYEKPRTYEGWRQLFEEEGLEIETVYRDIGPSIFDGGLVRGILRKLALFFFNLLPIRYTYQFVFICHKK